MLELEKESLPRPSKPPAIWRRCLGLVSGSRFANSEPAVPDLLTDFRNRRGALVPDWRRPALAGYLVIILGFVVLGTWSAVAKLAGDVVAPGVVTLESGRKIIQHYESGIVAKILVHEGQHVTKGQVLFVLDDTSARANATAIQNQLYALLAQEARLIAERDGAQQVSFPPQLINNKADEIVKDAIIDENKQFIEQRAALAGEVDILNSKIQQFKTQIQGISDEKTAAKTQLGYINSELGGLRDLLARNLVQKTRVLSLESDKAKLEGLVGQADADIEKAKEDIGGAHLQAQQLHKKFSEDVSKRLIEVRQKLAEMRENMRIAENVLDRTKIRAPRTGTIQNVQVTTIGGVIKPGEPLAELIPDNEDLIIDAQVSPGDVDSVQTGTQAEVMLAAFHGYTLPLIMGRVDTVSRDRIINPQTKTAYYLARVRVDKKDVPSIVRHRIMAGMPAEITVPTAAQTVISYLTHSLRSEASSAFREK